MIFLIAGKPAVISVRTIEEMRSLPTAYLPQRQVVLVNGSDKPSFYEWDGASETEPDGVFVVGCAAEFGRWSLQFVTEADALSAVDVAKTGSDDAGGLTPSEPKLTIAAATTVASSLITAGAGQVAVRVLDGGKYEEDVTVPDNVHVIAPAATLVGDVVLSNGSTFDIGNHYAKPAKVGGMVVLSGANAVAGYTCRHTMDTRGEAGDVTGIAAFVNAQSGGILHCEGRILRVGEGSSGITDTSAGFGHTHFRWNDLYLQGDNAIGLSTLFGLTSLIGYIDHILEAGTPSGTTGIICSTANTTVRLTAGEIEADTAFNVSNGTLVLNCLDITGTQTQTGGSVTIPDSTTTVI